jgi:hypothetical protein
LEITVVIRKTVSEGQNVLQRSRSREAISVGRLENIEFVLLRSQKGIYFMYK